MTALATYTLGVGLLVAIAAGWLGVQRLWLRVDGENGPGRDALGGRFSCGGDDGCGACEKPCARARERSAQRSGKENGR